MSLEGVYDPDNIFAKILRGEIPNVTVYEDDQVLSFMDAFPQSRGHTLVVPKAASRNLLDTNPDDLAYVIRKTQMIAKAVKQALQPDGITITQFSGAPAGQTVFHLHFHIIPRYISESLAGHSQGQMADMAELGQIATKISTSL